MVQFANPKGHWLPVLELGEWPMGPWNLSSPAPELYPSYADTEKILAKQNVPPDFESDGDLRYTHRHDKDEEIYIVGNRSQKQTTVNCRFRVAGRQPGLWDPVTGQRRALPEFREEQGRTAVPLQFYTDQSYFVLFRKVGGTSVGVNFPPVVPLAEITGSWQVTFDPKRGGPGEVAFQSLEELVAADRTGNPLLFGGAVYRKTFDAPKVAAQRSYVAALP